ncbi:microfibril-associated glycoprotein 4-like isoform X3 [Diabrotica virgifera virgifera]|uniref:Fibrinogen C-terminal domain-containing protein n=1 Tax=Diabrotica virgifera virgifera TaxID=50390 RepID=A0ABM5KYL0_DIAVI|nr:microfibril-associated glycoprotein 4-like isoform X2 [Diabrotica virgifera virgifera]XP_050515267.1 microfibril-associated glycoprotein 4-like isoform X3 [Diabrotica virgifera virgifera]
MRIMILRNLGFLSVVCVLEFIAIWTNGIIAEPNNFLRNTLLDQLDEIEEYGRHVMFKRNAIELASFTPYFNCNEVCTTLVGLSKGPYCPILKQTETMRTKFLPKSCKEIFNKGITMTGIYEIRPKGKTIQVLCDMETEGGGWTVLQKRFDGSEEFYRDWRDYKFGFGTLQGEFWLGLEHFYMITGSQSTELLIELTDKDLVKHVVRYRQFEIGPEIDGYPLKTASGFSGAAGDGLNWILGQKFSTKDLDQDAWKEGDCPAYSLGAWWYNNCYSSNLNGKYRHMAHADGIDRKGMNWDPLTSKPEKKFFLSGSRMLVRPNN